MKIKEILNYSDRKINPAKKDHCELCGFYARTTRHYKGDNKGLFVKSAENDNIEPTSKCF